MSTLKQKVVSLLAASGLMIGSGFAASFAIPTAQALPPGGASANTPGTSASLNPTTVEPCNVIRWNVSGFPAGQTVHVKIDDGVGFGDTSVQGTGVVATAQANSSGQANGTVRIPCDLKAGDHWLRFLASEEVVNNGQIQGVKGYSNRSVDFTVKAAANSNSGNSGASAGNASGNSASAGTNNGTSRGAASGDSSQKAATARANVNSASVAGASSGNSNSSGSTRRTEVRRVGGGSAAGSSNSGSASKNGSTASGAQGSDSSGSQTKGTTGTASNQDNAAADGASADNVTTGGGFTSDGQQILATSAEGDYLTRDDAAVVGWWAGGAILIVGLAAVGAYLFTQRRKNQEPMA